MLGTMYYRPIRKSRYKPTPLELAEQGRLPIRYQFLNKLVNWVDNLPAGSIGTPDITGFHRIIGGKARINYSNFYRDHYKKLVDEGLLSDYCDPRNGSRAILIPAEARRLLKLLSEFLEDA